MALIQTAGLRLAAAAAFTAAAFGGVLSAADARAEEAQPGITLLTPGDEEEDGQDFAQGAQGPAAACTIPESDDPDTWLCETTGPACTVTNSTRFIVDSAEYQAIVYQTFHLAGIRAVQLSQEHAPGTWVVAVDIDETVVSNAPYTHERERCGRGYSRESWADWTAAEAATPLAGAKRFIDLVYELGGLVVGVTNRRDAEGPATERVLKRHGLMMEFVLYRGDADDATGEKEARWDQVPGILESRGHEGAKIVMYMGDQITDFPDLDQSVRERSPLHGPFGVEYMVFPNPMYGEWEHE